MNELQPYKPPTGSLPSLAREPSGPVYAAEDSIDFHSLIAAFRRRFWLFAGIIIGVFVLSVIITLQMRPTYVATSRVAINSQSINVAPASISGTVNAPVVSSISTDTTAIDTEVAVVGSRRVAQRVVAQLNLLNDPEFAAGANKRPSLIGSITGAIKSIIRGGSGAASDVGTSPTDAVVDQLLQNLAVNRFNLTNAIDVSYADRDAAKAAAISNAFAQSYVDDQVIMKTEGSRQASAFLQTRISEMQRQYMSDASKLQAYKIAHNLMSSGQTTLTEQEIQTYDQSVAEAKAQAAADQSNLDTARGQLARGSSGDDVGDAMSSNVIASLRSQRATISSKVADMQGRYGDRYPQLQVAQRQLADIDKQIQAEINRVMSNLQAKADVSRGRLDSIEGSLSQTKSALTANNEAQVGLNQLQQNADASQALYESYLNRLKETMAQEGGEQSDARILSAAQVPNHPSRPVVWLNLTLGIVLGLGCGLLAVFISEMLDTSMTTSHDVERRLGQTCIGQIPALASLGGTKGRSVANDVVDRPLSAYAEAFRSLRTSLHFAIPGLTPQVIAITSALPKEGKTTVSICLSRSAALQGVRTVLVDCDTRHPGTSRVLGEEDRPGLTEVLSGAATIDEALILDPLTGAMVLTVSGADMRHEEALDGNAMEALLVKLRSRFELIVLDCPPLLAVADSRVIATKADATVLIAHWRKTSVIAVQTALRLLPTDQVRLAGVLLTQVDMKAQSRYGYGDASYYYQSYKTYYTG